MAYDTTDGTPAKVRIEDVYKVDPGVKTDTEATTRNASVPALSNYLIGGIILGFIAKRYLKKAI